jgi:hypothetical protein
MLILSFRAIKKTENPSSKRRIFSSQNRTIWASNQEFFAHLRYGGSFQKISPKKDNPENFFRK